MTRRTDAARLARASVVLLLSASYFACVFTMPTGAPFRAGMGDWVDPYFINFLLEHWYHSLLHFTSPVSPPMYFPARGTLGYSHGLILYVPFYAAVRPFLHPFQAYNATVFLVLNTGAISLYVIARKFARLGFVESLLVTAFFASSPNVVNEPAGVWTQRISVFLIPPVLLLALVAARTRRGGVRIALAGLSGLGFALLLTQDFYTAAFAILVSALFLAGALPLLDLRAHLGRWWNSDRPYVQAIGLGALAGCGLFVWIYLRVYLDHPAFPENQLNNALTALDASRMDFRTVRGTFPSLRSFELAFAVAALAWMPWFRVEKKAWLSAIWFALVSIVVLTIPLRIQVSSGDLSGWDFSVWKTFIAPIPGFSSIRDPRRVIECYELAVVLLTTLLLAQLPRRSPLRICVVLIVGCLLVTDWNTNVVNFSRPIDVYDRWVAAPITIDSSCESFFIKGASDAYMSRSPHRWGLYAMDAMFISLGTSIPTLNGYSAWWPEGWELSNPQQPEYAPSVARWIAKNGLRNVCALDIETRTMTPYVAAINP